MYFWSNAVNNLKNVKQDIANAIRSKGVEVPETFKIDELSGYVDQIETYDMSRSVCAYNGSELIQLWHSDDGISDKSMYNIQTNITNIKVGENVTNIVNTFYNCQNVSGNAYFYSSNISNVRNCFYNRNTPNRLNLYVPSNSTTLNTCLDNTTSSLVGKAITWTDDYTTNGYYYNTSYNIYIYPEK